jgi:hypothetical protein
MEASKLVDIEKKINKVIDDWVSQTVKDRFINRPVGLPKMSLWDKFKRGVRNWFWGPAGDKYNKDRWTSRFGDELGVEESFDPSIFTLNEYMQIRGVVDSLELRLEEVEQSEEEKQFGKLRLMGLIRSAADELKGMLFHAIKRVIMEPATPQAPPPAGRETAPKANPTAGATSGKVTLPSSKTKARAPRSGGVSSTTKKTRKRKGRASAPAVNDASASADSATTDSSAAPPEDENINNVALSSAVADKTDAPATSPDAPSNDDASQPSSTEKNSELRGFFYDKKKDDKGEEIEEEAGDFAKRIAIFFSSMSKKYKDKKSNLDKLYNLLIEERKKDASKDKRDYWYEKIVLSDDFVEGISKAANITKEQAKSHMISYISAYPAYLASLETKMQK